MLPMSWPTRLAELLKARQWSHADLSRAMGGMVSQPTISRWLSDKKFPRLDEAIEVARVLSVSLDDLAEIAPPAASDLSQAEREILIIARRLGYDRAFGRLLGEPAAGDYTPGLKR